MEHETHIMICNNHVECECNLCSRDILHAHKLNLKKTLVKNMTISYHQHFTKKLHLRNYTLLTGKDAPPIPSKSPHYFSSKVDIQVHVAV